MKIAASIKIIGVAKESAIFGFIGLNMKVILTKIKNQDTAVIKGWSKDTGIDFALKKANIIMATKNNIDDFKLFT